MVCCPLPRCRTAPKKSKISTDRLPWLHPGYKLFESRDDSPCLNCPPRLLVRRRGTVVTSPTAQWIERLSRFELAEIESATQRLTQTVIDWQSLRRQNFPLPNFGGRLDRICHEVLEGRGFALLRGLPVERWGRRLAATAFLGIGLHCGNLRSQNAAGSPAWSRQGPRAHERGPQCAHLPDPRTPELSHRFVRHGCPLMFGARQVRRALKPGEFCHDLQ